MSISNVHRIEKTYPTPLFKVDEQATVKNLNLRDIFQKNELGEPMPFMGLDGEVDFTAKENLQNE